jgi:HemY protein
MADIEDAEGHQGAVREWLARAARAPRDKAWVADGVISDRWAPVSPSGTLDAFVWRTPDERIAVSAEPAIVHSEPLPTPRSQTAHEAAGNHAEADRRPNSAAPPARAGMVMDPGSMAPDDPGTEEPPPSERGEYRLYAGE